MFEIIYVKIIVAVFRVCNFSGSAYGMRIRIQQLKLMRIQIRNPVFMGTNLTYIGQKLPTCRYGTVQIYDSCLVNSVEAKPRSRSISWFACNVMGFREGENLKMFRKENVS
jgi:hypothetical protein